MNSEMTKFAGDDFIQGSKNEGQLEKTLKNAGC